MGFRVPGPGMGVQVMERQHTHSIDGMWEVEGWKPDLDDTIWQAGLENCSPQSLERHQLKL